ncbi:hypothetical protein GCM10020255_022080 [Rhodococcus baikonurensis]
MKAAAGKAKDTAGKAVNRSVETALAASTGGTASFLYRIIPKPTDSKAERQKKTQRLVLFGGGAVALISMWMILTFIVSMSFLGLLSGTTAAMGAAGTAQNGSCTDFSVPRVTQGGPGERPVSSGCHSTKRTWSSRVRSDIAKSGSAQTVTTEPIWQHRVSRVPRSTRSVMARSARPDLRAGTETGS